MDKHSERERKTITETEEKIAVQREKQTSRHVDKQKQ